VSHKLLLDLPEEVYEDLVRTAEQVGQQPEELAAALVASGTRTRQDDPLRELFGTLDADVVDWSEKHDYYIGQALLIELTGRDEDDGR
jgi:hypothetical protein